MRAPLSVNLNHNTCSCTFVLVGRVPDCGSCTYVLYRYEVVTDRMMTAPILSRLRYLAAAKSREIFLAVAKYISPWRETSHHGQKNLPRQEISRRWGL